MPGRTFPDIIKLPTITLNPRRVAVLGLVTLACNLALATFSFQLLRQEEAEVAKQLNSKNTMACAHGLAKLFYDAGQTIDAYGSSRSQQTLERYDLIVAQIPMGIQELRKLAAEREKEQQSIARMELIANNGLQILNTQKRTLKDSNAIDQSSNVQVQSQLQQANSKLSDEVLFLTEQERRIKPDIEAEVMQTKQIFWYCLLAVSLLDAFVVGFTSKFLWQSRKVSGWKIWRK